MRTACASTFWAGSTCSPPTCGRRSPSCSTRRGDTMRGCCTRSRLRSPCRRTHFSRSAILNVCCPYTSRDEITRAVRQTVVDVQAERAAATPSSMATRHITSQAVEANLGTAQAGSPPLDILVRTSDVKRLSDFMLWQVGLARDLQRVEADERKGAMTRPLPARSFNSSKHSGRLSDSGTCFPSC